jgi:hypothetical protein
VLYFTFVLFFAVTAAAQLDQGQIAGTITDASGAIVPGATVIAVNTQSRLSRTVQTGQNGLYILTSLPVGTYEVTIEAPGFKKLVKTNVTVDAAIRTTLDASLEVGQVTESVTVAATTAQMQQETAQIGRIVESRQISDLALNGRNPINLALLKPGVVGGNFNDFNADSLSSGSFSINGGQTLGNSITLDGVNALRTRSGDNAIGVFNIESIQEVQVLTASYPAEYGRAMDGQIRFVSKAGGRDFHGTAYEFLRNSVFDANTWLRNRSSSVDDSRRPPPLRFNQPGYSFGGPFFIPGKFNTDRNKAFFFVSQEWIRYRTEATSTGAVPTAAMRQGDFSELLNASNPFFKKVMVVKDPLTGLPFPGNQIPQNRLSPNGVGFLKAYPAPAPGFQLGTANWIASRPTPRNSRKDFFRVDYYAGRHRINVRVENYTFVDNRGFMQTFDVTPTHFERPNQIGAMSVTSTLSPTVVNDFTFSAAHDVVRLTDLVAAPWQPKTPLFQRSQYGINFPYLFPGQKDYEDKIPTINVTGLSQLTSSPRPSGSSGAMYTWTDNLSWVKNSAHTFKFGFSLEFAGQNDSDQVSGTQNGTSTFLDTGHPQTTGVALGNVALGYFNTYNEIGKRAYTLLRSWSLESYAQDTWKATPNLTVEFGVRHTYYQPWFAKWNDIATFDARFYTAANRAVVDRSGGFIVSGDPYNGIVLPGDGYPASAQGRAAGASLPDVQRLFHGLPRSLANAYKDAFAPRFGLAYRLRDKKTVVRLGGGVFHHRSLFDYYRAVEANAPNQVSVDVANGQADNPGGGLHLNYPFSIGALNRAAKYPTAYTYSLSIQRELPGSVVVDVAYVGRAGEKLLRVQNINLMAPGTLQANPGINPSALRPYLGLSTINQAEFSGRSNYNSFQLSVDRRFAGGLGFGLSYTYSKNLDNLSGSAGGSPAYNAGRFVWALADMDRPHLLNLNYIYEVPFLRKRDDFLGRSLGGWQLSGVTFFRSGVPLSVTDTTDIAGVGGGAAQPWNVTGSTGVSGARGISKPWFNSRAFALPAAGTFGNAGRNILRGPSFQNWDLALFKGFRLTERLASQFRFEVFDFPNHPVLNNPDVNPRSGTFGLVTSKSDQRNIQFSLKFLF